MSKVLVAYFSRKGNNYVSGNIVNLPEGNTSVVAHKIQKLINADLFEIKTVKQYPIGYDETTVIAQKEQNTDDRPEIIKPLPDISKYETLIIGYPNWWGTMPMAVMTFLEHYNWSEKKILPFCTHEGSAMGSSESDLKKLCKSAEFSKGLPIKGSTANSSDSKIESWLKENGLL
ncbi:MAG: flavodoxin [Alphaproteobacteria bacterium]|nr:flavodoxin [Alphaproteobacteria bacterium]